MPAEGLAAKLALHKQQWHNNESNNHSNDNNDRNCVKDHKTAAATDAVANFCGTAALQSHNHRCHKHEGALRNIYDPWPCWPLLWQYDKGVKDEKQTKDLAVLTKRERIMVLISTCPSCVIFDVLHPSRIVLAQSDPQYHCGCCRNDILPGAQKQISRGLLNIK